MKLFNKHANQSPQSINMDFGKAKKGFFARLFSFIWDNKFAILGTAFGAIGAAVGAAMDRAASYNSNKTGFVNNNTGISDGSLSPDEESRVVAFVNDIAPTYQGLIKRVDSKITNAQAKGAVITSSVIDEINKVYFDIACVRANYVLMQNTKPSDVNDAKSAVLMSLLETLEKVINTYVKNSDLGNYTIVLNMAIANNNTKVGGITLRWPREEVKIAVKKFVLANQTQDPGNIIVIPNNGGVDAPILNEEGEEAVNTIEVTDKLAPKKYSLLKKVGIGAGIALVIKQLIK